MTDATRQGPRPSRPHPPDTATPPAVLYRLGRRPDPLALPPWDVTGAERFDDPRRQFRVLYAAEQRLACFVETLAPFRPRIALLAQLRAEGGALPPEAGRVPPDWNQRRLVGRFRLAPRQHWLDLRSPRTCELLRVELADVLVRLGLEDLDVSGVRGPGRALTQAIARWAYEHGFRGIAYRSRFDDALTCWAVFEGASWEPEGPPELITRRDPDLRAAARLFGLQLGRG